MTGHDSPESLVTMGRNTHLAHCAVAGLFGDVLAPHAHHLLVDADICLHPLLLAFFLVRFFRPPHYGSGLRLRQLWVLCSILPLRLYTGGYCARRHDANIVVKCEKSSIHPPTTRRFAYLTRATELPQAASATAPAPNGTPRQARQR